MHKFGDIILAQIQFIDTLEIKSRPALVLFEEDGNIIAMGITSNLNRQGISLMKKEGAIKDSIIRLNYIFTISDSMVKKILFRISNQKKKQIIQEILKRLE